MIIIFFWPLLVFQEATLDIYIYIFACFRDLVKTDKNYWMRAKNSNRECKLMQSHEAPTWAIEWFPFPCEFTDLFRFAMRTTYPPLYPSSPWQPRALSKNFLIFFTLHERERRNPLFLILFRSLRITKYVQEISLNIDVTWPVQLRWRLHKINLALSWRIYSLYVLFERMD